MQKLLTFLSGKKTYILMVAAIVYAIVGTYLGKFSAKEAVDMIWVALSGAAMRSGVESLK